MHPITDVVDVGPSLTGVPPLLLTTVIDGGPRTSEGDLGREEVEERDRDDRLHNVKEELRECEILRHADGVMALCISGRNDARRKAQEGE
jgi:hypothetical protein